MAVLTYYVIHEGAHLVYALILGVFKQINFMGLGVQIDIFAEQLNDIQLGMFCIIGSIDTLIVSYIIVAFTNKIVNISSDIIKTVMYYVTLSMLFIDPLYLSIFCSLFGGGDMNGISLIIPEMFVRIVYGIIFVINLILFIKVILPRYKEAFNKSK